jgi:aerobic-type carbon monoxide dehydrogenase small subunit (CoxS/CutS family)
MIMAALSLPPAPSLDDVRCALAGNICRCTGYHAIYRAILGA